MCTCPRCKTNKMYERFDFGMQQHIRECDSCGYSEYVLGVDVVPEDLYPLSDEMMGDIHDMLQSY